MKTTTSVVARAAAPARRAARLLLALVLACSLCVPAAALAETGGAAEDQPALTTEGGGEQAPGGEAESGGAPTVLSTMARNIASGTSGTCTWTIDANGALVVRPTKGSVGTLKPIWWTSLQYGKYQAAAWNNHRSKITSVRFVGKVVAQDRAVSFSYCQNLTSVDLSGLDASQLTTMSGMFSGCSSLKSINLSGLNTSMVVNMGDMFSGCSKLTSIRLSNFNTSNAKNMQQMFWGCKSLTSLDLSSFNTAKVTNMESMFSGCEKLRTIYVSNSWSTRLVSEEDDGSRPPWVNPEYKPGNAMFMGCYSLIGGNGTKYNSNLLGKSRARIDAPGKPGYLTDGAVLKWKRLWGKTQYDTMEKVAQAGWKRNAGGTVVVATGERFPDALSAAGVAGLFGAPVLLTNKASLPAKTKSELARIRPSRVIVAGGPGAVKDGVLSQIRSACGVSPVRCYGQTATDTAAKLATTYFGKKSSIAILATSRSFYDALAAAPVAYAKHYPIFLAENKDTVSRTTLSAMKSCGIKQVIVVGGEKALAPRIVSTLKSNGIAVKARLWGNDHYDTSRAIANWAVKNGMSANRMGVATSKSYYDALTGAALCGRNNAVLVLADDKKGNGKKNVDTGSLSFTKANKGSISTGYVFGGTSAVSAATYNACVSSTK